VNLSAARTVTTSQAPRKRVRAGGRIVWEAYGAHEGEQYFLGTQPTEEEAQARIDDFAYKVRERKRQIAAGQTPMPLVSITLADAAKEWLEWLENPDNTGHRSRSKYESQLRLHILPAFKDGNVTLEEITPAMVRTWLTNLTKKKGNANGRKDVLLKAQTANTVRICFSSLLTWCRKDVDYLAVNPISNTKQLTTRKRIFSYIHSLGDVTKLLAAVEGRYREATEDAREFLGLLVATGMRFGELLSLHWADVHLDERFIHVCSGGRGRTAFETRPTKNKNGEPRNIPILDAALPILQARHLRTKGQGFVFASPRGGIRREGPFTTIFKRALKKSGIERPSKLPLRVHDLRHTFAVHWVSTGGDIYSLSKVLGHSSVRTTEEYYADYQVQNYVQHYHRVGFRFPVADATVTALRAV
jgi:integrase/recombinase XerD